LRAVYPQGRRCAARRRRCRGLEPEDEHAERRMDAEPAVPDDRNGIIDLVDDLQDPLHGRSLCKDAANGREWSHTLATAAGAA